MCTAMEHYPPASERTLTCTLTWTLTIWHTDTEIQGKKSTFFQDHQNSDHWKQWHIETQGKKPTFFQDHLNSNQLRIQKLRSSIQHMSSRQDKNTADSQKQKKLSSRTHLFTMMIETLSGTILSTKFHQTMSS